MLGFTLLGDGLLYCILSASSLDPNSSGLPEGPFGQGVAFLTTSRLQLRPIFNSTGPWLPSWLRYIIVQRPLDLWNRMFNRHQVEITVMQFTGHSLPVHQSKSVRWEFFSSSHFISQFPPTRFPLITAIRMCHLLPVHHLGMAFLAGSKGQNITPIIGGRIVGFRIWPRLLASCEMQTVLTRVWTRFAVSISDGDICCILSYDPAGLSK